MIDKPHKPKKPQFTILDELLHGFSGGDVYPCQAYDRILFTTEQLSELLRCYHID